MNLVRLAVHKVERKPKIDNKVVDEFTINSTIEADWMSISRLMFDKCDTLPPLPRGLLACRDSAGLDPDVVKMNLFKASLLFTLGWKEDDLQPVAVGAYFLLPLLTAHTCSKFLSLMFTIAHQHRQLCWLPLAESLVNQPAKRITVYDTPKQTALVVHVAFTCRCTPCGVQVSGRTLHLTTKSSLFVRRKTSFATFQRTVSS